MMFRPALTLLFALGGCATSVSYGPVPHADYVRDDRCNPQPAAIRPEGGPQDLFFVTSRLPDCRSAAISFTGFRSQTVRYGRFAAPDPRDKTASVEATIDPEAAWWRGLEARARTGRVLVYVHGYRESFYTSGRDSAQIARLAAFEGPIVHYSWPSQGNLVRYVADETNMYWDERNFRRFLNTLATRPWVREIVLVAHSLGARLVIPAVEYVDATSPIRDASNISNIILASPDIDREDFERDIAEEVLSARRVNSDRRITVYASARDRALSLSRSLHGYPRLGSPYCFNPFEAADLEARRLPRRCYAAKSIYDIPPARSGFTIVDTSDVSKGASGHSDYLRSAPACLDFKAVVAGRREGGPGRRNTHLAHVFTLQPAEKGSAKDDDAICMTGR